VFQPQTHLRGALYVHVQYMDHGVERENEIKGDIFEIYIKRSFEFGAVLREEIGSKHSKMNSFFFLIYSCT
jgi:hypothetical protein